jgi:rubredoxin
MNKLGAPRHQSYRCTACGHHKARDEFKTMPSGDRARRCIPCDAVNAKRVKLRRAIGASDFAPSEKICTSCASLPHRVVGPKCRTCGLLYADEPRVEVDCNARGLSALARAM